MEVSGDFKVNSLGHWTSLAKSTNDMRKIEARSYNVVPPSYKLVYNPINYIDISTISPSEIRVINQLSYLGGTILYNQTQ